MTYKMLDLFCCAGGASMGLYLAGFDVTGVDNRPQPHYPFKFILADAMTVDLNGYDAYWASPPCQSGSEITPVARRKLYPNLIPDIRKRFIDTGLPYIIENVECMRRHLTNPVKLCGTQFGLTIWRHRYFETHPEINVLLPSCNHTGHPCLITGQRMGSDGIRVPEPSAQERRDAMQTAWMTIREMDEAIPPVYSEFLGKELIKFLDAIKGERNEE